jgi:hypothetical protein
MYPILSRHGDILLAKDGEEDMMTADLSARILANLEVLLDRLARLEQAVTDASMERRELPFPTVEERIAALDAGAARS